MKSKVNESVLPNESHDEWLLRTSLEAEAQADAMPNGTGWISFEQSEINMAKLKINVLKKYGQKKAA